VKASTTLVSEGGDVAISETILSDGARQTKKMTTHRDVSQTEEITIITNTQKL